tara:strand:+ start:262 stop:684 length:423 start_codon:yes stop_codon:yes gene_type:complete
MQPWWLYILVFLFGYVTHKTFYFVRATKTSISLIRVCNLVGLAILAKSMESFYYAHTARLRQMRENNESEKDIRDLKRSFNTEISNYKKNAIKEILDLHPSAFSPLIQFDNWNSAMKHLEENKDFVLMILAQDKNDKKTS